MTFRSFESIEELCHYVRAMVCCLEYEKIIQTFTPLSRKSLIDNMEPERRIRLHKFNSLRYIRQACPYTVTYHQLIMKLL